MTVQEGYLIMFLGLGYFFFQLFRVVIYLITDKIEDYRYKAWLKKYKAQQKSTTVMGRWVNVYENKEDLWKN